MSIPKVSVVIPVYRVEKYLVQCLESVVNQTLRELEIIILDEGDKDRCREIIDYYEQADPRIVTVHAPNPEASYGAKVNRGMDLATGEFLAIVEPDDFIEPDMYEQMYACAVQTGANIVKTPYYNYYNPEKCSVATETTYIQQQVPEGKVFEISQFPQLLAYHPSPWSTLYRRSVWEEKGIRLLEAPRAGYVDSRLYIDTYIKMGRIVWLNKPFYYWRRNNETSSSVKANWDYATILKRWNENLDMFPADGEEYRRYGPYFATKAWFSVFRHYLKGWEFDEEAYAAVTAFLNRFTPEQILAAPIVKKENIAKLLRCRGDPEGFRAEQWPESIPEPEPEPEPAPAPRPKLKQPVRKVKAASVPWPLGLELACKALDRRQLGKGAFCAAVYLLLGAIVLGAGPLRAVCAALSAACAAFSAVCAWAGAYWPRAEKKRLAGDRKLYICSTFYHVYVTLLKQLAEPRESDLVIFSDIPEGKELIKRLKKTKLFRNIWYVRRKALKQDLGKNALDRALFQHRRQYRRFREILPFDLDDYGDVYIYHDHTPLGWYLNDAKKPYHLLEDGLNFYQFVRQTTQSRFLLPHDLKYKLRRLLNIGYFPLGDGRYMIDLEVNENKDLQVRPKRVLEVPRAPLEERLTPEDRELLLEVFDSPDFTQDYGRAALVLTEPMFQDKVCASLEEQVDVYREIVAALRERGYDRVIVKPHPRDAADYSVLGVETFKKAFPIEMMLYFPELAFGCAAAVTSTALDVVPAAEKFRWKEGVLCRQPASARPQAFDQDAEETREHASL